MTDRTRIKICGLTRPVDVMAAAQAGASYVGFVFFPPSPRHLELADARSLALAVPRGVTRVALTVDADDAAIDALLDAVPLEMLQLHGSETPARVAQIRARSGLPVMKALGIAGPGDLRMIDVYADVADQLLLDAKPPKGADRPGGNAVSFDWALLAGRHWPLPWMLAGGLSPDNVAQAIAQTGAGQVDVSSGVETAPGIKDAALIRALVAAAG